MSLNIKNPDTVRLARELAERTGATITGAITEALSDQLARLTSGEDEEALVRRLLSIGRDCATRLSRQTLAAEHGEVLFGDDGLPR